MSIGLAWPKSPEFFRARRIRPRAIVESRKAERTVLLFFRRRLVPFCKGQLSSCKGAYPRFEKQASSSPPSATTPRKSEILRRRHKIEYPMLADPDSKIIKLMDFQITKAPACRRFARPAFLYIEWLIKENSSKRNTRTPHRNSIIANSSELALKSPYREAPHFEAGVEQNDRTCA